MQADSGTRIVTAPNVTPMIDVMLVLLIIFMVVTPNLLNGVVAEPPLAENLKPRPEGSMDRVLYVRAHRELLYGRVRSALDAARAGGVGVVGLVSEQKAP